MLNADNLYRTLKSLLQSKTMYSHLDLLFSFGNEDRASLEFQTNYLCLTYLLTYAPILLIVFQIKIQFAADSTKNRFTDQSRQIYSLTNIDLNMIPILIFSTHMAL